MRIIRTKNNNDNISSTSSIGTTQGPFYALTHLNSPPPSKLYLWYLPSGFSTNEYSHFTNPKTERLSNPAKVPMREVVALN